MRKRIAVGAAVLAGAVVVRRLSTRARRVHAGARQANPIDATGLRAAAEFRARLHKTQTRVLYELLSTLVPGSPAFTNYGYAALNDSMPDALRLEPQDEQYRYGIQLYDAVIGGIDLSGKDVLEVGCGRGGGDAYIARYLHPRSVVGVDIAARAIAFCRHHHHADGLSFKVGDAENLPFPADSFDAVINVESSHGYPNMERFLEEVRRVLRREGMLFFADMRLPNNLETLRQQFERSGFRIMQEQDISKNVIKALELDSERRVAMIRAAVPKPLRNAAWKFVGAKDSPGYINLRCGDWEYVRLLAKKAD